MGKLRALGAQVVQVGDRYHDAYQAMLVDAERTGALIGHAYDQLEVCAGQGTVGLELVEQVPEAIDVVLVAVGGGGLMAGVAAAVEGTVRVVGVEPENCPTLNAALAAGHPVDVAVGGVAADSLGATRVGTIAWEVAQRPNRFGDGHRRGHSPEPAPALGRLSTGRRTWGSHSHSCLVVRSVRSRRRGPGRRRLVRGQYFTW